MTSGGAQTGKEKKIGAQTETDAKADAKRERYFVPADVSNRHIHLCDADLEVLFGKGHVLHKRKDLTQPGQYSCEERLALEGPEGRIENIRIIGPTRKETQVEITVTDTYKVGIPPVIRLSGDLIGTPGGKLYGPNGEAELKRGVIVAARHLHLSAEEAGQFGLQNGELVSAEKMGQRAVRFGNIIVRAGDGHVMELHLDTDEGNAAGIFPEELVELFRP